MQRQPRGISQAIAKHDTISKTDGLRWLQAKEQKIYADQWRRQFWEDLTRSGDFHWPYLVAGLSGGLEVLQTGVKQFALCWVGGAWQRAAFYIHEYSGRKSVLLLDEKGEGVWNQAAVAYIVWC